MSVISVNDNVPNDNMTLLTERDECDQAFCYSTELQHRVLAVEGVEI